MAKARKILRHANAIRNIATVTKTMGMVATARFKQTFDRAVAARPYTTCLSQLLADVVARVPKGELDHPLLVPRPDVKNTALLVLTSHRGLCGGYNGSVVRIAIDRINQLHQGGVNVLLRGSGRRGTQILRARGQKVDHEYSQFDFLPDPGAVGQLAQDLMDEFIQGKIGGLEVAYMQFLSAGVQKPAIAQVLPLGDLAATVAAPKAPHAPSLSYEFIPSATEVLTRLLPAGVRLKIYQCFLDASVSEQIARRTAMQAATDNAEDMIRSLTIQYNRARQSQITTELAEIMGGSEALA